jgi:DNA-binding transcriptional LysR family regulator
VSELANDVFVSLPLHEGAVLPDRLRRLAQRHGFVADIVQEVPDTQTALALVSAEVGCHLTLGSVAANASVPHVAYVELDDTPNDPAADRGRIGGATEDVHLRAAWRRDDEAPALRVVIDQLRRLYPAVEAAR